MGKSYVEIAPANVIWRNLSMNTYEQNIRRALSYGATFGLILVWTFPGTSYWRQHVGHPLNAVQLHLSVPCRTRTSSSRSIHGWAGSPAIRAGRPCSGALSTVSCPRSCSPCSCCSFRRSSDVSRYTGHIWRLCADSATELAAFEGIPSKTGVELDVMTRYFIFLVIVSHRAKSRIG